MDRSTTRLRCGFGVLGATAKPFAARSRSMRATCSGKRVVSQRPIRGPIERPIRLNTTMTAVHVPSIVRKLISRLVMVSPALKLRHRCDQPPCRDREAQAQIVLSISVACRSRKSPGRCARQRGRRCVAGERCAMASKRIRPFPRFQSPEAAPSCPYLGRPKTRPKTWHTLRTPAELQVTEPTDDL